MQPSFVIVARTVGQVQEGTSSDDVRRILRGAIERGAYAAGESLPSSRELAARFGINRNTANRIYRELADDGLVTLLHNRPPYVRPSLAQHGTGHTYVHIKNAIWAALHECRLRGIPIEEIHRTAMGVLDEFVGEFSPPKILVGECNWADAERYSRELSGLLGLPVQGVLIANLHSAIDADIVVTPTFHVVEAQAALGINRDRVVGFLSTPLVADVMKLLSQVDVGPIGIVAGNPAAVSRLTKVLSFHISSELITATPDDPDGIHHVVEAAEVIACTARCREAVDQFGGGEKAATIRYHVDPASFAELRQRLASIPKFSDHSELSRRVSGEN